MSWADLDKLAVARPRPDGRATLIARDERTPDAIAESRPLTTLIAISRVVRGRRAIAERHGGHGVVIYATTAPPPSFLVDAVSAAGGTVFDGTREHVNRRALATTVQLDSAFCDVATGVRRRHKMPTFGDALDVYERELRRRPVAPVDPATWWAAIFDLAALAGELIRAERAGKWIEAPTDRFPLALDLGKGEIVFPGKLAQTLAEGGAGSMKLLVEATRSLRTGPPRSKSPPGGPSTTSGTKSGSGIEQAFTRAMPLLCDRRAVPIDRLTWSLLVKDEVDSPDMPVIAYVDDRESIISWPQDLGPPTPALRTTALANLANEVTELTPLPIPQGKLVVVTGGFYAAEALLERTVMERVRTELGSPSLMLVGVPARGELVACDGERATVDDDFQIAFLMMIERRYLAATERDRISTEAIVYLKDGPIGRVQSNLMDARRLIRSVGGDPDADEDDADA